MRGSSLARRVSLLGVAVVAAACGKNAADTISNPSAVASVSLTPPTASVNVGTTLTVTAQVKNAQGGVITNQTVIFSSSDVTKATVSSSGVVYAFAPGTVAITAAVGTHSGTSQLTIS